jgi:hypothetical protein
LQLHARLQCDLLVAVWHGCQHEIFVDSFKIGRAGARGDDRGADL